MDSYDSDIEIVLSHRYDNGADFWATPDLRLAKSSPYSTLEAAYMLGELGLSSAHPALAGAIDLLFGALRPDGRFQLAPKTAIYPCHTAHTYKTLCSLGFAADPRLEPTAHHLLNTQYADGGWRCNKFSFGRGPETAFSNPGPTLAALDAFRMTALVNQDARLDRAAMFLLGHWETRAPLGPCHYGIGTLFHKVTYPFLTYNLFYYVYVLSFYKVARQDARFLDALGVLQSKLEDGQIIVERPNAKLANLTICKKGAPSARATQRYLEILANLQS